MPQSGRIYLLFTPELCHGEPFATLAAALAAGVDLVQWRSTTTDREALTRAKELCRQHHVPLIINNDVMLALRSEADGAHVGQHDMDADAARKLMFGRILGVSTHNDSEIRAAAAAAADYVGFGPCYPTTTKGYEQGVGHDAIAAAVETCRELELPMYAIGGISPDNLPSLYALGVRRIAVSSYVLQHEDPAAAVHALRRVLL